MAGWLFSGFGQLLRAQLAGLTGWLLTRMIAALQATTAVHLSGWFLGPWRAMLTVAAMVALPLLLIGVTREMLAGNLAGAAYRGLVMPVAVGVGLLAARALLAGLLSIVDLSCSALVDGALGGPAGYAKVASRLAGSVGAIPAAGLTGVPTLVSILVLGVAGLLGFVIWVELAVRAALLYLLAVTVPLAAAGLFFRGSASWTRRLVNVTAAVALTKLVITVVMVLAASALAARPAGLSAGVGSVAVGLALLALGSFALPMTLSLVPHASEAALAAGSGALVTHRLRTQAVATGRMAAIGASGTSSARLAATAARMRPGGSGGNE